MTSLPLTAMLQVKYPFQVSQHATMVREEEAPVSSHRIISLLFVFLITLCVCVFCLQCFDWQCWLSDRKGIRPVTKSCTIYPQRWSTFVAVWLYEGRSINKLQNGAIPLIPKIGKIRNIRFVGNLILKIHRNFFDDDIIIVTSFVHRTQSICVTSLNIKH